MPGYPSAVRAEERVELGLGERERPLVVDRDLGGEERKGGGQVVGHAVDRDLAAGP